MLPPTMYTQLVQSDLPYAPIRDDFNYFVTVVHKGMCSVKDAGVPTPSKGVLIAHACASYFLHSTLRLPE